MITPPGVSVPFPVCEEMAAWLRREMTATERRDRVPFSPAAWQIVKEFEAVATRVVQDVVTTMVTDEPTRIVTEVSVREAAAIENVCRQAIQGRIDRKTLPARRDERGHYRINVENLNGAA